jgi:hypothetical protein
MHLIFEHLFVLVENFIPMFFEQLSSLILRVLAFLLLQEYLHVSLKLEVAVLSLLLSVEFLDFLVN